MKKLVLLLLLVACGSLATMAQTFEDDLYFMPKEAEKEPEIEDVEAPVRGQTTQVMVPQGTTVVVRDSRGNERDVDEYNRRYTSDDADFSMNGDTLIVQEKDANLTDRGEWVDGFDGSDDDYEYAMRIIRFRNPRFAVPVSSPLYWDIVYGVDSWNWNVYTDGFYAYAFPTYTNRLWWDWRYGSFGISWGFPYYSGYWGWAGYYSGYWGYPYYHHHCWYNSCYDPWYGHNYGRPARYNTRPAAGARNFYSGRSSVSSRHAVGRTGSTSGRSASRVVGTRSSVSRTGASSNRLSGQDRVSETMSNSVSSGRSSTQRYTRSSSETRRNVSESRSSARRSGSYNPSESSTRRSSSRANSFDRTGTSRSSSFQSSRSSSGRSSFSGGSSVRSGGSSPRGGSHR